MPKKVSLKLEPGFRSGLLSVIEKSDNQGMYSAHLCQCDCGRQIAVKSSMIYRGKVKSCGCLKYMAAIAHGISDCKDISGRRFGMLTVMERDLSKMFCSHSKKSVSWWLCKCDCGKTKSIRKTYLWSKVKNKACGCMQGKKTK